MVGSAKEIVEELQSEMESWRDSMPENLQDSTKGEEVSSCAEALQEIADSLETVDFSSVAFPGMMG